MMGFNIDANPENADWTKQSWDLPPYKSPEFMDLIKRSGMSLEQFRKLPVYKQAVLKGIIADDQWVGDDGGTKMNSMRFNKNGLPMLTGKLLNLLFECVYGWPEKDEINRRATLAPLRDLDENPVLRDFMKLIYTMSKYNCKHRDPQLRRIFYLAEPIVGPFEINSEGTSRWLARILAIKELYGLRDTTLKALLHKIKVK